MNLISELVIGLSAFIYACSQMIDVIHNISLDEEIGEMSEEVRHLYN